jgi:hypothetical protein
MEELDILKRAKDYIDSLARGIDPFSGEELTDDTLLNNVRLSRCFFYVAEVLGKAISSGGSVEKKKRSGMLEFALNDEQKARIEIFPTPTPMTPFIKSLNELADGNLYKRLTYTTVSNYLVDNGYLETKNDGAREIKIPTEIGVQLGIAREPRVFEGRTTYVNTYNENAQRFIIDHINEM